MNKVIQQIDERKEFITLDDGFLYYDPCHNGAIGAHTLREIADELDKRNRQWTEEIERDLGPPPGDMRFRVRNAPSPTDVHQMGRMESLAGRVGAGKGKVIEEGLGQFFQDVYGCNTVEEIIDFAQTLDCEWHIRSGCEYPQIERFRIGEYYVGEFRMDLVSSESKLSYNMEWRTFANPIRVEGCEPWT